MTKIQEVHAALNCHNWKALTPLQLDEMVIGFHSFYTRRICIECGAQEYRDNVSGWHSVDDGTESASIQITNALHHHMFNGVKS